MLESLFIKFIGLQACNFTKKRLQHRHFSVNIVKFKNTYFEKHLWTADSDSSCILHKKLNKIIPKADWSSRMAFRFFWNIKSLDFTYSYLYSFVLSLAVTCCTTCCQSLYHSLSSVVPLDLIRCHSLSFVVPLFVIRCHSLSFDVTRCTTCLPLGSLFYDFLLFIIIYIIYN